MMQGSRVRNKWTLDNQALEAFLNYLDSNRDRAGERYETIRQMLLSFFQGRGCGGAEDLVDVTIDHIIRRIDDIHDLPKFTLGVARKVALQFFRQPEQARAVPLADIGELSDPTETDPKRELEVDRRLRCIEKCISSLSPGERELVTEWFIFDKGQKIENKRKLAGLRGISRETLRVRACRARKRLRELVDKCLAESGGA